MSKGQISVHTENLLPIIKKWLYSDKDIYLRELVSNGQDAIMKLKKLISIGEAGETDKDYKIEVKVSKKSKTIKVCDNGIGMTHDEVEKYINQVAFSGAEDFIEKYEKSKDDEGKIIGHFGLGFYSAFMVSEKVEIDTKSYKDEPAVHWVSDGGTEYEISDSEKSDRGTVITLHVLDEEKEFLEEFELRKILTKYCGFLPVNIYLINEDEEKKEGEEEKEIQPVNDTNPLWLKNPSECSEEEYKDFYRKVFMDFNEPLFWIHLNVDFPFNLKGILYFPKLDHELQSIEGQIKLYNNQVFIADNIKEVIPEYLMLLKGVIDCPDLPLNVSRSFLQNDGYVTKVSNHITKKVSDKLNSLYKNDKETYEKYWDDISPFVKYGCLRDEKFYDRVKDILLFKNISDSYVSLKEIKEQDKKEVYYTNDKDKQAQYIDLLKTEEIEPVVLDTMIDNHFISLLEYKESGIKFKRVDSYISESLKNDKENKDSKVYGDLFKDIVKENEKISVQSLKNTEIPAIFVLSEEGRRMQEMSKMFGHANPIPTEESFVVNSACPIIARCASMPDSDDKKLILNQIYDMARLSHSQLSGDELSAFLQRSAKILSKLI